MTRGLHTFAMTRGLHTFAMTWGLRASGAARPANFGQRDGRRDDSPLRHRAAMTSPPPIEQTLTKLAGADLVALRRVTALPAGTAAVLQDCQRVPEALDLLETGGFLVEAARVLAHALPRREAVWWACMCATHTAPADLADPDRLAREAAERWVRLQNDNDRRTAMRQAEATTFESPEAWAAVAAFWSGESITPEGQPAVPPGPHVAGKAVAGAIALAAVRADPKRQRPRLLRFLASGRDIAAGGAGRLEPEPA
jgi:hypothetical protein